MKFEPFDGITWKQAHDRWVFGRHTNNYQVTQIPYHGIFGSNRVKKCLNPIWAYNFGF